MGMFGNIMAAGTSTMGANWEMGLTLIGRLAAQGDYDKADMLYKQMLEEMEATDVPKFKELVAEQMSPGRDIAMGSSGRTAQQGAIDRLGEFADQGGLDDQARGQLQQAMSATDQNERANRGAILASRARRGMSGSGDELAAMLGSQQGSANQARNAGLDIAGQARQRALQALSQQGQLAGQMRGQDIGVEKSNVDAAQARDNFNSKMRWAAQTGNNEGRMNEAMMKFKRLEMVNRERQNKADHLMGRAKRTQGDWSSMGRGMNMKHQGMAEGASEMPW